MKRSRFFYLHPEANAGKIAALDALRLRVDGSFLCKSSKKSRIRCPGSRS